MPRILVVDDDLGIRESLTVALEAEGFEVETRASAPAALARLGAGGIDAVVLDERLPGMTGCELLAELRRRGPVPPVVVVTAYGDPDLWRTLGALGARACFEKPFRLEALIGTLRRLLGPGPGGPPP
ncbi:MAG TPA: response regulator [Thermodesulfobacteriota bacterium]|nr:response regulator [Thermodesulfobacteriota bacterium]